MKYLYEPKTFLMCSPRFHMRTAWDALEYTYGLDVEVAPPWVRGPNDTDAEASAEFAGRVCYGSFGPKQGRVGAEAYLGRIMDQAHGSILEHACWSFLVVGASRGYTHQMVRHRAGWAYSQESTHFVRYGQDAVGCLCGLPDDPEIRVKAERAFSNAVMEYDAAWDSMLSLKDNKKKDACGTLRELLPTALQSRLYFTANARALRWFIQLRGARDNVPVIRVVAKQVLDLLTPEAPSIFSDFREEEGDDGFPVLRCERSKV